MSRPTADEELVDAADSLGIALWALSDMGDLGGALRSALEALVLCRRDLIEAREWERAAKSLLAVIHGDGGHYTQAHGIEKARKDAIEKIERLRAVRDAADAVWHGSEEARATGALGLALAAERGAR